MKQQLSALFDLATAYHACRDVESLLKTLAARVGSFAEARAVLVWTSEQNGQGLHCRARWSEAGERIDPASDPAGDGLLAELLESGEVQRVAPEEIDPEALTHLAEPHRERIKTALYAPIRSAQGIAGIVELLNKHVGPFTPDDAAFVEEAARMTGPALETLQSSEAEQHAGLLTVERLTSLYDISRVFNSTLEREELLPIIAEKIGDILRAEVCNIWLPDRDTNELYFAQQVGTDPTTNEDDRTPMGEGLIGDVAQSGKERLIEDASEEPLLAERQKKSDEFKIQSVICAPLVKGEEVLGVVEVVNKTDGTAFDEQDLFFLTSVSEQAAIALHNANLLEAERKVHELDALLAISKEITSTLNLDHVLTTVVHQAATVVPFDRCVIGLFDRSRFILAAVSGEAEVPKSREMDQLRAPLAWVADQTDPVSADQYEEGWQTTPEEAKERLVPYLNEYGYNGFYAVPLRDEQGAVGVMALLSGDAEFLSPSQLETLAILTSQVTVAIRNARLYQQVPLVSLLRPLARKKQKLAAISSSRWMDYGWKAALVALALIVVPFKMRVETNATVVPAERRAVSAEVGGVLNRIFVHEGDKVSAGEVLAQLSDSNLRASLVGAQADLAIARRELGEATSRGEFGAADQARLRMEMFQAQVNLYQEQLQKAQLRAPVTGVIVTPKVDEMLGKRLAPGDLFCELVEQEKIAAELNVPETDVALVHPGEPVALKLNAFSTFTFEGQVQRVAAKTISAEDEQFFVVRAIFPNQPEHPARGGMVGRAKIAASGGWFQSGWYPVGYVLLRAPARWAWQKAWTWWP